jgi:hypothetical protein
MSAYNVDDLQEKRLAEFSRLRDRKINGIKDLDEAKIHDGYGDNSITIGRTCNGYKSGSLSKLYKSSKRGVAGEERLFIPENGEAPFLVTLYENFQNAKDPLAIAGMVVEQ